MKVSQGTIQVENIVAFVEELTFSSSRYCDFGQSKEEFLLGSVNCNSFC